MKTNHGPRVSFLLGAGASYGHIIARNQTPQVMSNFLSKAVSQGLLTEQEFPELAQEIIIRGGEHDLFQACVNLEKSGTTLESFLGSISDLWTLQLSRFFLYRYLGEFCKHSLVEDSAYRKLAKYIKAHIGNVVGIVSLNYETLCEVALASVGIRVSYALTPDSERGLLFLKPHGSVNFRFPIARGFIGINVADWPSFLRAHNSIIETNRFSGQWVESYQPSFSFERDFLTPAEKPQNRKLEYIPALVPPLGRRKYHDQFDSYQLIWRAIEQLFKRTDELIVIGSAMNEEEFKLWDCLEENLPKVSSVKIVDSSLSRAWEVVDRFKKHGFGKLIPEDVAGFYEYASLYLEAGKL
jgi:hypothetical protein